MAKAGEKQMKKQILLKAVELLETKGWIQDELAINAEGDVIDDINEHSVERATCFCLQGACEAAMVLLGADESWSEINVLLMANQDETAAYDWNDAPGRTKEEVIKLLHDTAEKV